MGHTRFATLAHMWPLSGPRVAHMWETRGAYVADNWPTRGNINRYINGNQEANAWHSTGTEVAHVWQLFWPTTCPYVQSTGTEMTIKTRTHGSEQAQKWPICGSCSSIQKAQMWQSTGTYIWQSTDTYMAVNRHIHGNRQAYRAYMAVNMHIRSSHTHIAHMWQLFVHKKGKEVAIKMSINW